MYLRIISPYATKPRIILKQQNILLILLYEVMSWIYTANYATVVTRYGHLDMREAVFLHYNFRCGFITFPPLLVLFAGNSSFMCKHAASKMVYGLPQNSNQSVSQSAKVSREDSLERWVSWWRILCSLWKYTLIVVSQAYRFCIPFKLCKNDHHPAKNALDNYSIRLTIFKFQFVFLSSLFKILPVLRCATFVPSIFSSICLCCWQAA